MKAELRFVKQTPSRTTFAVRYGHMYVGTIRGTDDGMVFTEHERFELSMHTRRIIRTEAVEFAKLQTIRNRLTS